MHSMQGPEPFLRKASVAGLTLASSGREIPTYTGEYRRRRAKNWWCCQLNGNKICLYGYLLIYPLKILFHLSHEHLFPNRHTPRIPHNALLPPPPPLSLTTSTAFAAYTVHCGKAPTAKCHNICNCHCEPNAMGC